MNTIDRRRAALEAQIAGAGVVGIWQQPAPWNDSDDLVRVCGTDERLTQEAFAEHYPGGTLVRVIYADDWRQGLA